MEFYTSFMDMSNKLRYKNAEPLELVRVVKADQNLILLKSVVMKQMMQNKKHLGSIGDK